MTITRRVLANILEVLVTAISQDDFRNVSGDSFDIEVTLRTGEAYRITVNEVAKAA